MWGGGGGGGENVYRNMNVCEHLPPSLWKGPCVDKLGCSSLAIRWGWVSLLIPETERTKKLRVWKKTTT